MDVGGCVRDMGLSRSLKSVGEGYGAAGESPSVQQYFEEAAVAGLSLINAIHPPLFLNPSISK
ncbi:MAG: hypothetical protein ABSG91_02070 [Syntrophobacteraceae bacterium]|jgi:hypothetical protein